VHAAGQEIVMNALTTAGRIVFALPFIVFGVNHLIAGPAMASYVPVPGGVFWIYFTGIALIAGGVGVATKLLGKWAALGLAILLAVFVVTMHVPGMANPATRQMSLISFLKDIALAGGALTWAGIFAAAERGERLVPPTMRGRRTAEMH
jgi:uncharacterized membrane protein YphA (DoxX/SURF4 family)